MAINFLEELRKETKENYLNYLQTDKAKFYDKLVEDWASETLAKIQNSVMAQVQKNNYTISGSQKVVNGHCYLDISILTGIAEKFKNSNEFLMQEIKANKLETAFHPIFIKSGESTEYNTERTGLFSSKTTTYVYYQYTLKLSNLATRALKLLQTNAKSAGITVTKIGFNVGMYGWHLPRNTEYMFNSLYESQMSLLAETRYSDGERDEETKPSNDREFNRMIIEYSVTY